MISAQRLIATTGLLMLIGCGPKSPPDPLCSTGPIPETSRIKDGHGALLVVAAGTAHFYAVSPAGAQAGYARTGEAVGLPPGRYQAKLNNSLHPVSIENKVLTRCSTGTLSAKGGTDEYYYVLDEVGTQLAYAKLNGSTALFPGKYVVKVNNTVAPATIKQDATTDLQTGLVTVQGETDEYFYVLDSGGTQLAYAKLSKPVALLPGAYTVKLNNTTSPATVQAGGSAAVPAGSVIAHGSVDQYYYVLDGTGTQMAYAKLGHALSLMPGSYTIKVNGSTSASQVAAGKKTEYRPAVLTVKGARPGYYYVLDPNGTQLGYTKLSEPLALAPGNYSVKVGESVKPVALAAGESKMMTW